MTYNAVTQNGFRGRRKVEAEVQVAVSSGSGSEPVVFDIPFQNAPDASDIGLTPPQGAAGTYTATSLTASGLTITIASETALDNQNVSVVLYAHDRP